MARDPRSGWKPCLLHWQVKRTWPPRKPTSNKSNASYTQSNKPCLDLYTAAGEQVPRVQRNITGRAWIEICHCAHSFGPWKDPAPIKSLRPRSQRTLFASRDCLVALKCLLLKAWSPRYQHVHPLVLVTKVENSSLPDLPNYNLHFCQILQTICTKV